MRKTVLICCLVIATGANTAGCYGQAKFLTWFRQRVGERKAKDADQAKDDAKWQAKHLADPETQKQLAAAVKKSKCNTCHVKGKKKTTRNAFGDELSKLLQAELKMDTKGIKAALKSSAPKEISAKVEKSFYLCLDKSLKSHVKPDDKKSETFGDRLKEGKLP